MAIYSSYYLHCALHWDQDFSIKTVCGQPESSRLWSLIDIRNYDVSLFNVLLISHWLSLCKCSPQPSIRRKDYSTQLDRWEDKAVAGWSGTPFDQEPLCMFSGYISMSWVFDCLDVHEISLGSFSLAFIHAWVWAFISWVYVWFLQ